jgi:hypothetical protein
MNRLWKPLKKIGERLTHIKDKNIEKYSRFNIYCQDESRFGLLTLAHKALIPAEKVWWMSGGRHKRTAF